MPEVWLREVAYTRSGDKGDVSNVAVIPYRESDYFWLRDQITPDRARAVFGQLVKGPITCYPAPGIFALNVVMEAALGGGVSRSLNLDAHGKSWGNLMLRLLVTAPPDWTPYWPVLYPPSREVE